MLALLTQHQRAPNETTIWRDIASGLGLVLVVLAISLFNPHTSFPGWAALVPVIGTVLLIGAGPRTVVSARVLASRPLVYVGLISYPLYLWHWPLLVLMRRGLVNAAPAESLRAAAIIVGLAIVAAMATYHLLELPLRTREPRTVARRATFALGLSAAFGVLMVVAPISRFDADPDTLRSEAARRDWTSATSRDRVYFAVKGTSAPSIAFIGDSFAEQYFPAVRRAAARRSGLTIAFSTHRGCPFLPGQNERECGPAYRRALALASSPSVKRVVIASAWDIYPMSSSVVDTAAERRRLFNGLARDVQSLRALGKEVTIIAAHPHAPEGDPELLAAHMRVGLLGLPSPTRFATSFPLAPFRVHAASANAALAELARRTGTGLIDPTDALCPNDVCITVDEEGTPIRRDELHLRPFAAIRYLDFVPGLVAAR